MPVAFIMRVSGINVQRTLAGFPATTTEIMFEDIFGERTMKIDMPPTLTVVPVLWQDIYVYIAEQTGKDYSDSDKSGMSDEAVLEIYDREQMKL